MHDRRSFLAPTSQEPSFAEASYGDRALSDSVSDRSSLYLEAESLPEAGPSYSRRSFLDPDSHGFLPDANHSLFHGRRSVLASSSASASATHRSFLTSNINGLATTSTSTSFNGFKFVEYNGARKKVKTTHNMNDYLKHRKGWIGVITEQGISRTIRLDCLAEHMMNNTQGQVVYALVKPLYVEQYMLSQAGLTGNDYNQVDPNRSLSSKRIRSS